MKTFATIVLLLGAGSACSQTVWRCGADGRIYSDQPCAHGAVVAVADTRTSAEVTSAREVLARDQALARELHRQNRESERAALARGSGLAGIAAPPRVELKPKVQKKAKSKKHPSAAPDTWRAVALGSR